MADLAFLGNAWRKNIAVQERSGISPPEFKLVQDSKVSQLVPVGIGESGKVASEIVSSRHTVSSCRFTKSAVSRLY